MAFEVVQQAGLPIAGVTFDIEDWRSTRKATTDEAGHFSHEFCGGRTVSINTARTRGTSALYDSGVAIALAEDGARFKVKPSEKRRAASQVATLPSTSGARTVALTLVPSALGQRAIDARAATEPATTVQLVTRFLAEYEGQDALRDEMAQISATASRALEERDQQLAEERRARLARAQSERAAEDAKRAARASRVERACGKEVLTLRAFILGRNPHADQGKCVEFMGATFQMVSATAGLFRVTDTDMFFVQFPDTFRGVAFEGVVRIDGFHSYTTQAGLRASVPRLVAIEIDRVQGAD